jgi:hypothetical protein
MKANIPLTVKTYILELNAKEYLQILATSYPENSTYSEDMNYILNSISLSN